MSLGQSDDDRAHAEILALQELVCADIAFFKSQQWQAAYYGLALYAGLVALPSLSDVSIGQFGYVVLWIVSIAVFVTGLYVLSELESALVRRRNLLPFARKHFTPEALLAYGGGDPREALKTASDKVTLKWVFISVYIGGFAITSWVLYAGFRGA